MSGLNDDIEEDVQEELPDQDKLQVTSDQFKTLKEPTDIQNNTSPAVLLKVGEDEVDSSGDPITPTIKDLFGENVKPNELPDLNAKIVLVENNKNTIEDAKSTLKNIQVNQSISQEDIYEINSIIPGYLNDNEKIEYYTKTPTLTRYTTAVNTIGFKIANQEREQLTLTLDTFNLLKESIVKTQSYLKENLINNNEARKNQLGSMLQLIEENVNDIDISGYHKVIKYLLLNTLEEDTPHSVRKVANLFEAALSILRKPTAFSCLLNKVLFLKEDMDQDFVFYSLSSPDNLSEKSVKVSLKELIVYTYSQQKLDLLKLIDDVLTSSTTYVDNSIFSIKDNEASDIDKEPEPLNILKRESNAIVAINTLLLSMVQFDTVMFKITDEIVNIINSIP